MATTVIDKLIVELGLDPKDFTKGTKQAAAAVVETEKQTNKSASEMVQAIRRVTAEFVSLFLAVRSIKDVVGVFGDINAATRQLGIDATNTDEAAAALKDLGNIAEITGGKADDAAEFVQGLNKAIFDTRNGANPHWSDQLTNFQIAGIDTGAVAGQMRPIWDILRETNRVLNSDPRWKTQGQRYQEAKLLGFGGLSSFLAKPTDEFTRLLKEQMSIPQVTQRDTRAAYRLTESWDVLKQRIEAELRKILTTIEPALEKLFRGIGDFIAKHTKDISAGIQNLLGWFSGPGPQNVVDGLVAIGDAAVAVAKFINGVVHPISSGAIADKETGLFSKSTVGKWLTEKANGADSWLAQNKAERAAGIPSGIISNNASVLPQDMDPNQLAQELAALHQKMGGDAGDPNWTKTLGAYSGTPLDATQGSQSSPRARANVAAGKPTAMNLGGPGGRGGSVQIDEIKVYTQATDADGIARDIDSALNRKLTVTLADGALA